MCVHVFKNFASPFRIIFALSHEARKGQREAGERERERDEKPIIQFFDCFHFGSI